MLKTIALENFVHFKDKTVIDLDTSKRKTQSKKTSNKEVPADNKALSIFVGANHCGKSAVSELIRRCMTNEINVSVTNSFNDSSIAYAFCKFSLDGYDGVISGVVKEPGKNSEVYKVFITIKNKEYFIRKRSLDTGDTYIGCVQTETDKEKIQSIFSKTNNCTADSISHLLNRINSKENQEVEPSWNTIENKYVSTLPLRGIGMVQWTKSDNIKDKINNYKKACERAEVISTLLFGNGKDDINKELEREIFEFITYPDKFQFTKNDNDKQIYVKHNESESPFPLLKTSEGILEAKLTSLLLAYKDKDIQTLCLEDPDRGMHPQMIERLKTMLCREAHNKTIIVVTHSPYFIDTTTIDNTHVFFRKQTTTTRYECAVQNFGEYKELSKVADIETLRTLLFATKVLLVEGVIDKEVVQGIFTQYKRDKTENENNQKDITTFQVVSVGGCSNTKKVQKLCKSINLPCLCLWDLDNVVTCKKKTLMLCLKNIFFPWDLPKKTKFITGFSNIDRAQIKEISDKYDEKLLSSFTANYEDSLKVATLLESGEDNTFIWRHGAVEDAILSSPDRFENICKSLNCKTIDTDSLKKKLKDRLTEEQRKAFYAQLIKVKEILRFIHFLEKKEEVESEIVCYRERNASETTPYNPCFKPLLGAIIVASMGTLCWYMIKKIQSLQFSLSECT